MSSVLNQSICEIAVLLEIETLRVLITKTHFAICCLLKQRPGKGYKLLRMSNRKLKYY